MQKGSKPALVPRQDNENMRGAASGSSSPISILAKKKAPNLVPPGLVATDSLKTLMKRHVLPASMQEHIEVQRVKSEQLAERYLARVAINPRREASLTDPQSKGNIMLTGSHITLSNYTFWLNEYNSLKGVLHRRFREVKDKDYRLYDDVDVDHNSCQMRITLHPFEELFRRKLVIDAKRAEGAPGTFTSPSMLKRSQTVKLAQSPSPGAADPDEESWIRKKLGIKEAEDSEQTDDKEVESAKQRGACPALLRCCGCRGDKVSPMDHDKASPSGDEEGSEEEAGDESWCTCLRRPSEEEIEELSARYCDRSLNWLPLDNGFRLIMIKFNDSVVFDTGVLLLIVANSVMLGMVDYAAQRAAEAANVDDAPLNVFINRAELAFTVLFTLEAIVKIVAQGLILEDSCYLRDGWNWLDFTVVVTGLLSTLPNIGKIGALRTFRLFRPLRSLSAIPSMKILMTTLLDSVRQLSYVIALNLAFVLIFAVIGMNLWGGVLNYRCRLTKYPENGDWLADPSDERACSANPALTEAHHCPVACGSLLELQLRNEQGVLTNYMINSSIPLNRDTFFDAFNYGVTNFDNFGSAYLTIFQCTTLEGWTKIKGLLSDGYGVTVSSIFFCVCVLVCNYFLLNLTIAVMLDKFKKLNQTNKDIQLVKFQKNAKRVQELKDLKGIMKLRKKKVTCYERLAAFWRSVIYKDPGEPPRRSEAEQDEDRYRFWICRMCWKVIKLPIFNTIVTIVVLLNTLALAADRYPTPDVDIIGSTNRIFIVLFSIELFVKLVGLEFNEWRADLMNVFDLIIVASSVAELIITTSETGVISAFRGIRLFRVFKLTRSNLTLRSLTDSMIYTFKAILNFLLVFSLFIYVFSLLGMDQFAGLFKFDSEGLYDDAGKVPRQNFDSLLWACVTVFQVLMGDRWPEVMYMAQLSDPEGASVFYFVILVLLGKTIMLNLLLSIMLGNFEMSSTIIRAQVEDQILAEFEESKRVAEEQERQRIAALPRLDRHRNELMSYNAGAESATDQAPHTDLLAAANALPSEDAGFRLRVERVATDKRCQEVELNGSLIGGGELTPVTPPQRQKFEPDAVIDDGDMQLKSLQNDLLVLDQKADVERQRRARDLKFGGDTAERPDTAFTDDQGGPTTRRGLLDTQRRNTVQEFELRQTAQFKGLGLPPTDEAEGSRPLRERRGFDATVATEEQKKQINKNEDAASSVSSANKQRGNFDSDDSFFADDQVSSAPGCCARVLDHMSKSSLFIFHRDGAIRRFMLRLTTAKRDIKISDKDLLLSKIQNAGQQGDSDEDDLGGEEEAYRDTDDISVSGSPVRWFEDKHVRTEGEAHTCQPECEGQKFGMQTEMEYFVTKEAAKSDVDQADDAEAQAGDDLRNATNEDSAFARFLIDNQWAQDCYIMWRRFRNCVGVFEWTLNQWFEQVIYILIFISIVLLVIENPQVDPKSQTAQVVEQVERAISIMFAIEAACRIIALGFLFGTPQRKAYLRQGANQIDFFVVVGCDAILLYDRMAETETLSAVTLKSFKVLRCLRALRPLRVISRSEGLKLAVGSLLGAMPSIFTGMIVCQLVIFIYATIGVSLFKGRFRRCYLTGDAIGKEDLLKQVNVEADCLRIGGLWLNSDRNFDSIENALFALYEMITLEGWMDVMYMAVDSREIGMQPKVNTSPFYTLYFVSYLIVGNVFVLNLFVGIVIDKFNRLKDSMCGYALMTSHQREWVETEKKMVRLDLICKKQEPKVGWQVFFYRLINHQVFEYVFTMNILLSTVEMSLRQYKMSAKLESDLDYIKIVVIVMFNLEAMLKIAALHEEYFQNNWYRFEFCILAIINIVLLLQNVMPQNETSKIVLNMLATVRVARVLSMARAVKQLRMLLDSLLNILPSIVNVISLISLMFFIFSIIGVNMFSNIRQQDEINEHANFKTFGSAMVVLLRCATGEKWNVIMRELASTNDRLHLLDITGRGTVKPLKKVKKQKPARLLETDTLDVQSIKANDHRYLNSTGLGFGDSLFDRFIDQMKKDNSSAGANSTTDSTEPAVDQNTTTPTQPSTENSTTTNATELDKNVTQTQPVNSTEAPPVVKDDNDEYDYIYCYSEQSFESLWRDGPQECGTPLSYFYFAAFTLVIRILMLNLFIAVVIEGFSTSYKEHTNCVRGEHFDELLKLWEYYDPKGTAWIGVNDLMFLVFELDAPLGRRAEFETIAERYEEIVKLQKTRENQYINTNAKFVVNIEKNMIIPHRDALKLLEELDLPVYRDPVDAQFKCHFSDVVKRLSRFALDSMITNFNPNGIQFKQLLTLKHMWTEKYPDLKERSRLLLDRQRKVYTCYRYFAANYLVKIITNAHYIRKKAILQEQREASKSRFARLQKEEKQEKEKAARKERIQKAKAAAGVNAMSASFMSGNSRVTARSRADRSELGSGAGSEDDDDPVGNHIRATLAEQYRRKDKKLRKREEIEKVQTRTQSALRMLFKGAAQRVAARRRMSQEFDPARVEDTQRSTWWMPKKKNNYQMRQWVDDLDLQVAKTKELNAAEEARREQDEAAEAARLLELQQLQLQKAMMKRRASQTSAKGSVRSKSAKSTGRSPSASPAGNEAMIMLQKFGNQIKITRASIVDQARKARTPDDPQRK